MLRELSDACREAGLSFGVYLSPWDSNHPDYGTAEYNRVFVNMLEEVLSGYGPIFEVWFDGANGEGPNGKRQVYDWPAFHATREAAAARCGHLQRRWTWCALGRERARRGFADVVVAPRSAPVRARHAAQRRSRRGHALRRDWVPPECDVSIRPGWFYRRPKTRASSLPRRCSTSTRSRSDGTASCC